MRVSKIFIVLLFAGTLASQLLGIRSSELQAKGLAKLTRIKWNQVYSFQSQFINAEYAFSNNSKTITLDLPRKSEISYDYVLNAILTYDTRKGDNVATITLSKSPKLVKPHGTQAAGTKLTKGRRSTSIHVTFRLVKSEMKKLTSNKTAEVDFIDPGSGDTKTLTIVFRPNSNVGNYISRINSPNSVRQGDLIEFEVHLENPAASGGVTFYWRMNPKNDFDLSGSNSQPAIGSTLRQSVIPTGNTLTRFNVRVKNSASVGAGRKIETWVENTNTTQAPYYKTRSFTVNKSLPNR